MSAIDPTRPETWPAVLTVEDMALIYRRRPSAITHALKPSDFRGDLPQPFLRRPARWRRADVQRHVLGARGMVTRS